MGALSFLTDSAPATGATPHVSIVIAARNEAAGIERAVRSVLEQEYNEFDVVVVNDRSTDETGPILDRLAHDSTKLCVIHNVEVPAGWLGKNYALQLGAQQARGEYIVFSDGDVIWQRTMLARAVAYCRAHAVDHLAVAPEMTVPSYWTGVLFGEFLLSFMLFTMPWRARTRSSRVGAGIGAFNMVRTAAYRAIDGHARIAMRPDDDVKLGYVLKKSGYTQDVALGWGLLSVQWYGSVAETVRGLEKNSFAVLDYSFLAALGAVASHFAFMVLPWLLLLFAHGMTRFIAGLAVLALLATWTANKRVTRIGLRYGIAALFGALVFEYTVLRAAVLTLRQDGIRWRDTHYPLAQLRRNRV